MSIREILEHWYPIYSKGSLQKKKSALNVSDTDISSTATPSLPITRLCPLGAKYAHFL